MRYKWIELHNYAGIYNGMGLDQIKIDFTQCKTNKIIIRGNNGSGKSTLMNAISVNPDTNDKFIPNMEARKNLCIIDNDIEYIIRYIHPVTNSGRGTTKGYVSKIINGKQTELNPNGNISSCKDIIYEEFNLDANFMALSQLSSEDRGLVDKKPVERKKLVNNILNSLDTYNAIYKTLNKKSSIFKSTINSLTYKIDSIGDESTVQLNLKSIEDRLNDLNNQKNSIIESMAAVKLKITEYNNILMENNYNDIMTELSELVKSNKILYNHINKTLDELNIDDIDNVEKFYNYINTKCIELESSIDNNKKQIPLLLAQKESECKDLQNKNERLNSLQSDYNYLEIKKATEDAKSIVEKYDEIFNEMGLKNINLITKDEYETAMQSIQHLKTLALNMMANYDLHSVSYVYNNRVSIKNDILNISEYNNRIDSLKDELFNIDKELSVYESMRNIADKLKDRPSKCKIDTCPYITSAIEADKKYPLSKFNSMAKERNKLSEELSILSENTNNLIEYAEILRDIESIEREMSLNMKFIHKLPIDKNFDKTFISRIINNDQFLDIDNLYKYIDCGNIIEEYKVAKENLHNYEVEYKIYESKNEVIESIITDIDNLTRKTDEISNNINSINDNIYNMERELNELKNIRNKIESLSIKINDEYKPSLNRQIELEEIKESLEDNNEKIKELNNNLNELNHNLGSINTNISSLSNARDDLKHQSSLLVQYKKELEIYSNKFSKKDKIKYYSSPSTGIQTLFMELYMNKIILIANDLLSLLFGGEFTLQPFIINDNEFRIPCIGSGLMHDDISSMSTAQKCMISMIISFSLLYQSSTKYNIIKVDEIDGGLDIHNRGYFINLLDKLMDLLKCEQCFIVSHNNELNTSLSDIIILKNDTNEVYNGNVIWKY